MVLSTAQQPNTTYLTWKRFTFPDEKGPIDAIAVPKRVGDTLNPAYAIIVDMAVLNFWAVFFGIILYFYMVWWTRRNPHKQLQPIVPKIWNKRSELVNLVIEALTSLDQKCPGPLTVLVLLLCLALWVGQKATAILIPPLLLVSNAAPVNPAAIYVPDTTRITPQGLTSLFALQAPRFLRALGSTAAGEQLRNKIDVSPAEEIGRTGDGDRIMQVYYSYSVTGTDMGLQLSQDLTLKVTGSCFTEYSWFNDTVELEDDSGGVTVIDYYNVWRNLTAKRLNRSLYDGPQPSAVFNVGLNSTAGTLPTSNSTWAAVVSSLERFSFTSSDDPWYLTTSILPNNPDDPAYKVLTRRPALSCWQDDVWSYGDQNSTVEALDTLPGLEISDDLKNIFTYILGTPMIVLVGQHLQASALLSSTTANEQIFDAASSSFRGDLERLVLAAYVATINSLTDLTLYSPSASDRLPNLARDGSRQPRAGVADFVVWSPDVAALSTVAIITIPCVCVGLWIVSIILLYWTAISDVAKLESDGTATRLTPKKSKGTQANQSESQQVQQNSTLEAGNVGEKTLSG